MGERIRWVIARIMDRSPDTCWASLVIWAIYPDEHPFLEILELRHTAGRCGDSPYCGKCYILRKGKEQ